MGERQMVTAHRSPLSNAKPIMDLTTIVSYVSICMIIVAVVWPLNIPIMAMAYKIRHGYPPIPMEMKELWLRSVLGSLGIAVLGVLMAGFNYVGIGSLHIPELPVQLGLIIVFLAAGTWYLFWAFAFDDALESLGLLLIYIFLPTFLLLIANWLGGDFLNDYRQVDTWFGPTKLP
jgi:hypothetical protein